MASRDDLSNSSSVSVQENDVGWPLESDIAFHATPINPEIISKQIIQNEYEAQGNTSTFFGEAENLSQDSNIIASKSALDTLTQQLSSHAQKSEHINSVSFGDEDIYSPAINVNTTKCSLGKSPSERSTRSVRSLHATGTYPIGSLRVHSPSPTRSSTTQNYEFLKCGDVIVIRGVNPNTLIGYDTVTFTVQEEQLFEGLRDIPIGVHLIWGSANKEAFRQGFWIISSNRARLEYGEVIVKRWDKNSRVLDEEVSAAEIRIQQQSIPEFVQDLVSYSDNRFQKFSSAFEKKPMIWSELTSSIRGSLITKITGNGWNDWLVSSTQKRKPTTNGGLQGNNECGLSKDQVLNFTFPHSDNRHYRHAVGREQISQAIDTSGHIQAITRVKCDDDDADEIIGELQFSYLTGICLKNSSCIEHWAYIVKMVFQAFLIAIDEPRFFSKFIKAVHAQLIYDEGIEGESILDHEEIFRDDFKNILTVFKSRLTDLLLERGTSLTTDQKDVGKAFEDLESWLCRWNWDLRGNTEIEFKEPEANTDRSLLTHSKSKKNSRNGLKLSVGWA
ncbi:putative aar2 protein [Erysiphe neolycopersici]|uniref:Putative aar2 protein n=1 Tax=Erysiphe neolycopersici TaxID=212602 RepID=A0A420I169_9PEZI|nr:putative aar2 protein [Erysiphe neolycopersici]